MPVAFNIFRVDFSIMVVISGISSLIIIGVFIIIIILIIKNVRKIFIV